MKGMAEEAQKGPKREGGRNKTTCLTIIGGIRRTRKEKTRTENKVTEENNRRQAQAKNKVT